MVVSLLAEIAHVAEGRMRPEAGALLSTQRSLKRLECTYH